MKKIASTVFSLIVAPFVVSAAGDIAKPHLPDWWARSLGWTAMLYEWPGFPWVVAGCIGVLFGLWLDKILSAFDGRNPITTSGRLQKLAYDASEIAYRCDAILEGRATNQERQSLQAELFLFGEKLSRLGINPSYGPKGMPPRKMLENIASHLRAIEPAMRAGDISATRRLADIVWLNQSQEPVKTEPQDPWSIR